MLLLNAIYYPGLDPEIEKEDHSWKSGEIQIKSIVR